MTFLKIIFYLLTSIRSHKWRIVTTEVKYGYRPSIFMWGIATKEGIEQMKK